MELQFHKTEYPYLRTVQEQTQTQEQTLELKLSEGMPDVGRVLLSWGQPVLRSKEWRSDGAQVTGGAMVWVMYQPEDGSAPRVVEGWIPFQMRWDFPGSQRDGLLLVQPWVRNMDARCISARKIMLRGDIAVHLQALQPDDLELYSPCQLPDKVQLLKKTHSLQLLTEAGEKPFLIDEDLQMPADLEQILYYTLQPIIHDKKVVADKAVFRGTAQMHILYLTADGEIRAWDQEIPFSQFAELDKEYVQAAVSVLPAVTSVELEKGDQTGMRLKAGLTGQYAVSRWEEVEMVEDAYCPGCETSLQTERISAPGFRNVVNQTITAEVPADGDVLDVNFLPGAPQMGNQGDRISADLTGHFQVLYRDEEGILQGSSPRWEESVLLEQLGSVQMTMQTTGRPQTSANGARAELMLEGRSNSNEEMTVVSGLTIDDEATTDPNRPSLILRRAGENTLWQLARENGSTVDRIKEVNGLQEQPEPERMLLIPVI